MTKNIATSEILIVGDDLTFGQMMRNLIEEENPEIGLIRFTTYERFRSVLSRDLIEGTDLFILGLWKNYPTGLRAEGLLVAEELARMGTAALVVSSLSFGNRIEATWYWDLGSSDTLASRCSSVICDGTLTAGSYKGKDQLKHLLKVFLEKPSGHA